MTCQDLVNESMGKSRGQVSWLPGLSHVLGYGLWRAEHIAGVTWKWCDRRRNAACCSLAATSGSHESLSGSDSFLYKCCKWDMHQGYSCITVCCNVMLSFIESLRSWIKGLSLFNSASQLLKEPAKCSPWRLQNSKGNKEKQNHIF